MFTVTVDRRRRLLEVRMHGMLDREAVQQLRFAILKAMAANSFAPGEFLQLVDTSCCPIQTQQVYFALAEFGTDPQMMPGRLAVQTGDTPSRMQSRRASPQCAFRVFETRAPALAWLCSPPGTVGLAEPGSSTAAA